MSKKTRDEEKEDDRTFKDPKFDFVSLIFFVDQLFETIGHKISMQSSIKVFRMCTFNDEDQSTSMTTIV